MPDDSNHSRARSIAYESGCLGLTDPSPSDGYPGCLLIGIANDAIANGQHGNLTVTEIVPPTLTGVNQTGSPPVKSAFRVVGTVPYDEGYTSGFGSDEWDFFYDESTDRLVWTYYKEYAGRPADDDLVWGWTDFTGDTPTVNTSMYRWTDQADANTTTSDPYRATKYAYNVRKIPSGIATSYFGGNQMLLGPGKCSGSRGSSAGPSAAIRPWTFPTGATGWDGVTPLSYFNSSIGYPRWYVDTKFEGDDDRQWGNGDTCMSNFMVRISYGGDTYEGMLTLCSRAIIDTNMYPGNNANAKPTDGTYTTETYQNQCAGGYAACGGVATGTYNWPNPLYHPVYWYGIESYDAGNTRKQNPSNNDYCPDADCFPSSPDDNVMPNDTNLVSTCDHGTGPNRGLHREAVWFFWNLAELGNLYAGTSGYTEETFQPHDSYTFEPDPDNDGWQEPDTCVLRGRAVMFATMDETNNFIYVMRPRNGQGSQRPYNDGPQTAVDVFEIDVTGGGGGGGTIWKQNFEGGSIGGGTVQ